jgi:hypothetical protein
MTLNRITLTLTTLIAALFALLLLAALTGAASPANAGTGGSSGTSSFTPWHHAAAHPTYAKAMFRVHHMCDEMHHPAMKPALKP